MTTTFTSAELGESFMAAVRRTGLDVQPSQAGSAGAVLGGPLLVIRLPLRAGSGVEACVVAVDGGEDRSGEQLVQALAQVGADILDALIAGDATIEAVPALDVVLASFDAPAEVALVGSGTGALLWSVDRRGPANVGAGVGHGTPPVGSGGPAAGHGAASVGYADPRVSFGAAAPPVLPPIVGSGQASMQLLRDVHLDVSVELGRTEMTVAEVLELTVGAVVELDRAARAPVDIRVNGTLLAKGEVVVVDDEYAVRVTEIIDPAAGLGS